MEKDWVIMNIDPHRMWVSLKIKEPEGEEYPYFSPEFIEQYLRDNGITAGINREAVEALANNVAYGEEVIVAKGKDPVKGRDGFYQYTVVLEDAKSKPTVREDGSVDYYNSLKLAMVQKDEVFAVYIPATKGEYGYTVFSEMVPPIKGRDLRPLRGKGFVASEDGREYKALYDGRIFKENERIVIEKIYIVKGDLDIEQGNIKFNGDVEIKGDVRSGLQIETEGSIFIHGHVGASQLTAGGSITIRKGVQGRNKCTIISKGDVACSFIERCIIMADGNIYADSILDCDVTSKQKVILNSKKGLVLGGKVFGMQGVQVKESGNDAGVTTTIHAGVMHDEIVRLTKMEVERQQLEETIELLDKNLKIYDKLDGSKVTKETEALRMKILRAKVIKASEKKHLDDEINTINAEIERARRQAKVRVTGVVYAGTQICIGRNTLLTRETWKDVTFFSKSDEIVVMAGGE